jgi:hypothetical protein
VTFPALVAVPDRSPLRHVLALRADDRVDLRLQQLVQHADPDTDAQRQQPFLRRAGQLAERLQHRLSQPLEAPVVGRDRRSRYGPHAVGPAVLVDLVRTHHGPNATGRGGRTAALKFYELRDKLGDWTQDVTRLLREERAAYRSRP